MPSVNPVLVSPKAAIPPLPPAPVEVPAPVVPPPVPPVVPPPEPPTPVLPAPPEPVVDEDVVVAPPEVLVVPVESALEQAASEVTPSVSARKKPQVFMGGDAITNERTFADGGNSAWAAIEAIAGW